mmetsp:Transcript_34900/g.39707  ORF Transcript_34900/g.39707 Transcript_34900/m.39707 type:complete len:110 (-) Transcript_34900:33-362(-)
MNHWTAHCVMRSFVFLPSTTHEDGTYTTNFFRVKFQFPWENLEDTRCSSRKPTQLPPTVRFFSCKAETSVSSHLLHVLFKSSSYPARSHIQQTTTLEEIHSGLNPRSSH